MRITENSNYDTIRDSIYRSRERMGDLQFQSATLKKINTPSDDPIGAAKVLELRTDKANNDQYQMNSKLAETYLDNSDHALTDLSEIILRMKELALNQASSPNSSPEARYSVSEEVEQLYQQSMSIGNRKVGDRFLFGGYQTQKPPVDAQGEYHGDDGQMMVEIANDVFVSMNLPGAEVFNTHPKSAAGSHGEYPESASRGPSAQVGNDANSGTSENVNLFNEIKNFRIALLTGDIEGVRDTLDRFDQVQSKLVSLRAKVGARVQGLLSASRAIERHNITNATLSSSLEDADMAQVVANLGKEETVFKSALASSKRLVQPTLLDFLR